VLPSKGNRSSIALEAIGYQLCRNICFDIPETRLFNIEEEFYFETENVL